jgi:hypothetical protein
MKMCFYVMFERQVPQYGPAAESILTGSKPLAHLSPHSGSYTPRGASTESFGSVDSHPHLQSKKRYTTTSEIASWHFSEVLTGVSHNQMFT